MLEEQPRPLAARDRDLEFQWFLKGNREPPRIGGARGATETPRSRSGGAGESESVTARPGESQEAEGKPRWSLAKPGGLRKVPERPGGAGLQERTKKP